VRKLAEPDGLVRAEVQGGGRRFRALLLLVKQGLLAPDAAIPTVPNEKQITTQISLAENVQREALHPLDEYRAFADMLAKGKTEEDIAAHNRCTVNIVKQRLRLASASPVLLKAFEDEKITLATLMAFCVTDNHGRQEQVWKDIKGQSYHHAHSIKQRLMEDTVPTHDKRVKFVGLKAYEKAGGLVERDLFDEDHQGYIKDVDLLNQLVQAKLDRAAEKVKAQGWGWAMAAPTIAYEATSEFEQLTAENEERTQEEEERLQALEAERSEIQETPKAERSKKQITRLEDINAEIDALENPEPIFKPEDIARAGATLEIDSDGKLHVEYGYLKPEDVVVAEPATEASATGAAVTADRAEEEADSKLPDSLVTDLTTYRTASLQAALAEKPDVAFVATLHAMTLSAFNLFSSESCLQIRADTGFPNHAEGLKEYGPMMAMIDQRKAWGARLPRESLKLWEDITAMSHEERMQLLAFLAASTLNVVVQKHDKRSSQVNHSQLLAAALGYDIRTDWKPTAENFFNRVTKAAILAAVTEARDEKTSNLISHCKKQGMALEAERLVDGTGWIPMPMRTEAAVVGDEGDLGSEDELPDFLQSDDPAADLVAAA
jgi:ParB family chromosome partitioning protein